MSSDLAMLNETQSDSTLDEDATDKKDINFKWTSPATKSEFVFNPSVCNTFLQIKDLSVILVPWRVFHKRPDLLHSAFNYDHGQLIYSDEVNVMMDAPMLSESNLGNLDEFTQTWEVKVNSEKDMDALLIRLTSFPSILSATLTKRKILGDNSEMPVVLFLDPSSTCIQELARNLGESRETFRGGKRFSVEVDLGPSVEMWSRKVLRRDFICVGARFCVTNGSKFNHVWDMSNVLGCLPCLICGLIGTSVYRTNRKLKYIDISRSAIEDIGIIGTKTQKAANQRFAIYTLMKWINSVPSPVCEHCKHSFSKSETDVKCSEYHVRFQEQQHVKDKSAEVTACNDTSLEDTCQLTDDADGKENENTDEITCENTAAVDTNITSVTKHYSKKKKEKDAEALKAKERRLFLFPYYEEANKYEKDKNYPFGVEEKARFVEYKTLRKSSLEKRDKDSVLFGPFRDSPYHETNVTSVKRMSEEQMLKMHLSILQDEEMENRSNDPPLLITREPTNLIKDKGKPSFETEISQNLPTVLCESKQFIDMSKQTSDDVFATSINIVYIDPESDEDVPVPHAPTEDEYACEFTPQHTPNGHAFILQEQPSDEFFKEYDPLSHVDVLNFLACKNAKTNQTKPNNTETKSKRKRNRPIKQQPKSPYS